MRHLNPQMDVGDLLDAHAYRLPGIYGAQTANHANSTSPTSATLSNTAAGYTTLGGRYQFAAPNGAATDFALFGYQVPSTNQVTGAVWPPTGYRLVIKGIAIAAFNSGAAVATTATILDWSLGINSTAVSLATSDAAPVYGPRRLPLGTQGFIVGAGIGAAAPDIVRTFAKGLIVQPGGFVHVIVQVPVGTATSSQIVRGDVMLDAYFEEKYD